MTPLLVFTLGNSSDLFLLERARELNVDEPLLPILWLVFHVAKSAGNILGGYTVDRIGAKPLLIVGWLWYAAVYFGFALASSQWHVWALFVLYAVYYALTEPREKTLVVQLAGSQRTGVAYGWYNLLMGIGQLRFRPAVRPVRAAGRLRPGRRAGGRRSRPARFGAYAKTR